jgi:L-threonylcarbamoyladenylate synthase
MVSKLSSNIKKQIEKGILILRQGGLVAYPTDTVYGLGACAWINRAVEKVYRVKGRSYNMPLPLLLSDISQITEVAESVPPVAWSLIHAFLPGALTLVLPKSGNVPDIISGGGPTVAVRIPDHPVPIALIEGLGAPIVGTSANLSGKSSPLTADEVYSQLGDSIDLIIDGGPCPGGKESTIVDITRKTPEILREGGISKEELEKAWGALPSGKEKR